MSPDAAQNQVFATRLLCLEVFDKEIGATDSAELAPWTSESLQLLGFSELERETFCGDLL